MGFPSLDIAFSKKPVALILTPSNELQAYQVKPHLSKFFVIKDYGVFEVDANCASRMGKTPIFFYYTEYPKPIHLKYLSMLHKWAKGAKVDRVKQKDIRHSSLMDRLKAKHSEKESKELVEEHEMKELNMIHQKIDGINQKLNSKNNQLLEEGKPPLQIDPKDYGQYIIENLVNDGLLTKEEGIKLQYQLLKQEITIDDFMAKLDDFKTVQIATPIPLHPRLWLEDFPVFKPSETMNYIKTTRGLSKKIEQLGVTQVRNLIPAAWIFVVVLAVTIGGAVLVQNVLPNIDKWIGRFFGG